MIPEEIASNYNVLSAPEPEKLTLPEPFPHVKWNAEESRPYPNSCPCPVHSYSPDNEFYADCNYETNLSQSLAEDFVECSNISKPDLSSNSCVLQSEYEGASDPKYSGDESKSTLSSIPLVQGSPRVICGYLIDNVPTASNSSSNISFTDATSDQIHPLLNLQLPIIPQINHPVTTCSTGTCDPILYNFTDQPNTQDVHHGAVGGRGRGLQGGRRGRRDRERRGAPDS